MPRESGVVRITVPGRRPYFRCSIGGRRHHLGTNRQRAYRRFAELVGDIAAPTAAPETVNGAVAAWLREHPGHWSEPRLKLWITASGALPLRELKPDSLEKLARHLRSGGYGAFSVREAVRCAHAVCRWCVERRWSSELPRMPILPRRPRQPRDVQPAELTRAFEKLRGRSEPILRFILLTGCRPKEARTLLWKHVDLDRAMIQLPEHKTARRTGRIRTIYLPDAAISLLKAMDHRAAFVFLSRLNKPYTASGLRAILRRRGINSVYSLRHTFAQHALESGTPMEVVAKLLGHSDLSTVQVYAQVRDRQAVAAVKNLNPLAHSPTRPQSSKRRPKRAASRRATA